MTTEMYTWWFSIRGSSGAGHIIRVALQAPNAPIALEMAKAMYRDQLLSGPSRF
jgi:1,2-phenylacetyl-CoA epoxidase PaaB subunit